MILILILILIYIFYHKIDYIEVLKQHKKDTKFPFRYLCDRNQNILPIVLVSAPFRDDASRSLFKEYTNNGIKMVGITSYKVFPKKITDPSIDSQNIDNFNYYHLIKNWISCFNDSSEYGFDKSHNLLEMSESDFYDTNYSCLDVPKKYDFIYSCLNDDKNSCPLNGWNAVNRNFELALKCLPIMINEFGFKVLIMGRTNCGLENGCKNIILLFVIGCKLSGLIFIKIVSLIIIMSDILWP